ncbi:hypothetical protein JMF89_15890 [Clostridiaceae bacterium UIB06]|nr:hypothetical protein [Clostridiaceae bacterium UIB06]
MQISATSQGSRYGNYGTKNKRNISEGFDKVLKKKQEANVDTKEFLSKLTSSELYEVQKENHLANNINVQALSREGAENLFLQPVDAHKMVDLNDDGVVEVGEAKMFIFPPPNAPEDVKEAWDETSKDMTSEERMHIECKFIAKQIEKNSYKKPDGTWGVHKPGDAGWVNIFGDSKDSIISLCNEIIDRIDNPLESLTTEQKKEDEYAKNALKKFITLIG